MWIKEFYRSTGLKNFTDQPDDRILQIINLSGSFDTLHTLPRAMGWLTTNQSSFSGQSLEPREVGIVLEAKWQTKLIGRSGRSGAPGLLRRLLTLFLPLPPCRESKAWPKIHLCVWWSQTTFPKLPGEFPIGTSTPEPVRIRRVMRKKARPSPQRRSFSDKTSKSAL